MSQITRASRATTSAALILATSALLLAQQPPLTQQTPTFRGGVDLIQLVVTVLDDRRQPVRGLTAADFTVLDEGRASPIRAFAAVDLPAPQPAQGTAAWTREVAPDIATNQVGEQPGRLVVILMDRSIPLGQPTITARAIAAAAVEELGPADLAALVSTSGGVPQNFTADRARLLRAIDQRDWSTGISQDAQALPTIGKQDPLSDGRCLCGVCVFDTVTRVAEALRDTPGRSKALFFVGSGLVIQAGPRDPQLDPGCDHLVRVERQRMFDAIDLSNLTVHSIDPSGLASIGPQTRAGTPGGPPLPEGVAAARRRAAHHAETTETLQAQGTLHVLPDRTGGRTVVNRNGPEQTVPEIFRESESYYILGFEADPAARAGSARSIEVRVARRGVRVSTRRQYLPPTTDSARPALPNTATVGSALSPNDALTGLLPDASPPLTVALAAFATDEGPNGLVSATVDATRFVHDTESAIPLEVSVTAVDQTGRPVASARQTSMIRGPRPVSSAGSAIHLPTHLALPRGDYEIRIAVTDAGAGSTASVFSQIVVPDFARERLTLSDIALVDGNGAATASTVVEPTTQRSFSQSATVRAFVQTYQGTTRTDTLQSVSMRVRIVSTQNVAVLDQTLVLEPADFSAARAASSWLTVPVQNLPPGEYLLRLDAAMGDRTAQRAVRFAVR